MRPQIQSRIDQIERYIARALQGDVPEDIQASLAQFGAVLVCGFVERSVEIVITERLSHRAHDRVLSFIKSHFRRGTNYDCEAIAQLLNRFDSAWYRKFSDFVDKNADVKEGLSSVYGVRNTIAHGGTNSLALKRVRELFEISKRVVQAMDDATS